jgi:ATP/ADP translocase/HEAT repeat protein
MALFNVHPGEGKMVLLLLGLALLENFANVMARTTTYALFLAEFDAETLPYVYIGIAVFATLVSYAYLKLTERLSLATVLIINSSFLVLLLAGLWLGTTFTDAAWVTFSLPIAFGILNTLMITAYWGLIGRTFNIQQSKRLTGLIATAETVAFMVGGFLMPVLVLWVGSTNVLLVAAILMTISLGMLLYVIRFFAARLATSPEREETTEAQKSADGMLKSTYIRLILGLFTLFVVGIYFVDNTFFALAEIQYPDADQLASFVGLFWGASSVLVLLMQGFVSGRVLVRFGVGVVMMLTPTVILIESGAMAVIGTLLGITPLLFWLGVAANVSRVVLDATDQAAVNILYQPLPADVRTRAQTMVNGIFYPISIGLAGVLLLLFRRVLHFDVVQSTYVLFLIAVGWLSAAILLRRAYPQALLRALTRRDFGDTEYLVGDLSSLAIFHQGLTSPHTGVVVYSLDMLEQIEPEHMVEHLPQVLCHPEREVRLDVLKRIERHSLTSALSAIRERLEFEDSSAVFGAALRTMAILCDDDDLFDEIYAYLDHPDLQIRRGAFVGMLRGGQFEGIAAAAGKLTESVNSDDPAERGFAAQVLGEGGIRGIYRPLLKLLQDDDPGVRRLALVAAGKLRNPKLWPMVVENLASIQSRATAVNALVSGGESVVPELRSALVEGGQARPVLIRLIQVLGRIRGEQAITVLKELLSYPDEQVRTEVLISLNKCGYRVGAEAASLIEENIKAEAAQATWISAAVVDLGEDEATSLLKSALEQHLERHRLRLFLWCSFVYDPQVVQKVQDTLSVSQFSSDNGSGQQKSYAKAFRPSNSWDVCNRASPRRANLVTSACRRSWPARIRG